MTGLVIGQYTALFLAYDAAFALWAGDDALDGLVKFRHVYAALVTAGGQQSRFVDQVLYVGTGKSGSATRQCGYVHVICHRLIFGVHAQDSLPLADIGVGHDDLAIEPPGT